MKDVGLVGLPYSGKSTLFTALTRVGAAGGRANQAVVPVPDPRLDVLARMERSRRVVPARVRFVDVPGGPSAQGLAALRETDVLCLVLRAFGPDAAPAADLKEILAELLLADLAGVETALEGARRRSKGRSAKAPPGEVEALERALAALESETRLADATLADAERGHLRALAPLTLKPVVTVVNLAEAEEPSDGLPSGAIGVSAELEAETAGMPPDEAAALLAEFGVTEPGLPRVVAACYRALDLVTFLTTGEDETRAWEVRRGALAPEAAGAIHSDLQRGFIRAEVIGYEELVATGSFEAARAAGLLRVEGKAYEVREGDVLHVRFAV